MMGGGSRIRLVLLLVATYVLVVTGLPMENHVDDINYMHGFPDHFADGLPTEEFKGSLPEHSRSKREQEGVSQHIADMLAAPYEGGPPPSDISSLFQRKSLRRPVRQSLSSDSTRRFPLPFQPSHRFLDNLVQRPVRPTFRKPQPTRQPVQQPSRQPTRQPVQQPSHQPDRRPEPQPTRQFVQDQRRSQRPQQNFTPESQFPSFSEAQAEHKRTNGEGTNHFTNDHGFFESSRIREKREVTARQVAAEAEARKDTPGFMPNTFPTFESVGGFGKMPDKADQSSSSFVPEFKFNAPIIDIPDFEEQQPKFTPISIPSHFTQSKLSDGPRKLTTHFTQQRSDTSGPLYREQVNSRSRVSPWIFIEQFSEEENNLQSQEAELSRKRRKAGEPGPIDPSQIPHKRVPRVEKDPESADDVKSIPHVRVPRQQHMDDQEKSSSELLMTRIPLASISRRSNVPFDPFPEFQFPAFESEKLSDRLSHRRFIPNRFTSEFGSSLRNPGLSTRDHILPESQITYPTYNPRRYPFPRSSSKPFFPPATRKPGPRPHFNAPASTRGPSTRGASLRGPTFRPSHGPGLGPKVFREFHDPFYGPDFRGGQEAINKPDFHFPSPSPHREDEYPNENSLLGSGNFEILRGGTFYEPGDYHLNHHPYDHLLDGGYSPFHSNSHSNNYVDDFFSNFRDFSEFAARSDSGEVDYHGFSEPITSIVDPNSDMDHTGEESSINETQAEPQDEKNKSKTESKGKKADKDETTTTKSPTHGQPKNIQELLEEIDPRPSHHSTSELIVDEKDPMIAMF